MNINNIQEISQGTVKATSRQESSSSDESISLADYDHHDNKKTSLCKSL